MQSRLRPAHYLSPAIFEQERERIFRKLWLLAGFRTSIAEPGAYLTRSMAGLPVLVQNCGGDIRAFETLCPHRQMPLQHAAFGQARMVCPYHGWVFDDDGRVKTVPHEQMLYAYTPAEREKLCLRRYAVAVIGNLVFVNLADLPMPLDDQFTPGFQAALADISSFFGAQAMHVDIPVRYNWKLNYENVLDGNHIPYIHPKTFQPLLREGEAASKCAIADSPVEMQSPVEASTSLLQMQSRFERCQMQIAPLPWHAAVHRYGGGDFFHTFSIFPNVNFISPGGLSFIAQQFEPVAPGQTQLRMTLTLAKAKRRLNGLPALLRTYLKGEAAVVNEDIAFLESLQAHLHEGAPSAQHGRYETRLRATGRGVSRPAGHGLRMTACCVVGCGTVYDSIAAEPHAYLNDASWEFRPAEGVEQIAGRVRELLANIDPASTEVFVAVDAQALNYVRLELYGAARLLGIRMLTLVHATAWAAPGTTLADNVWLGPGVRLGTACLIDSDVLIGMCVRMDSGVHVAAHGWIGPGSSLGNGVRVGTPSAIGEDVHLRASIQIGRHCTVDHAGTWGRDLPDGSFLEPEMPGVAQVIGAGYSFQKPRN